VPKYRQTQWQTALVILSATVVGATVLACLYWAQAILVPFGLAIFLCFLLTPLVTTLQRRHVSRTLAVITAVLVASLVLGGIGWVIFAEVKSVTVELPKYTDNIKDKLASFQEAGQGGILTGLRRMIAEISGGSKATPANEPVTVPASPNAPIIVHPTPVVVQPETPAWVTRLLGFISPVLESLAQAALTMVLVIFMLFNREDLRDRLIRLIGHGRITVTTKALDDAGQRISRYLLTQLLINATYGFAFGLGLFAIGFQHALLWGFLAGALRYVPYIGTWVTSVLLIALSLAMFPGWTHTLLVLALIGTLELVTYNLVEPYLFSQSIGVSEVALVVAAAFWAFLWGPIGLILSGPLTVCLVVLGEYVPQLEFLAVLLADQEALDPDVRFYQRLSAKDQDEASQIVSSYIQTTSPERVYDDLLIPALAHANRDRHRNVLDEDDVQFIWKAIREIVEDLRGDAVEPSSNSALLSTQEGSGSPPLRILGCPARDEADHLALEMFQALLDPRKWELELAPPETLAAEILARVAREQPAILCIVSLPPGGVANTRYLCKRLRARFPDMKILISRLGLRTHLGENREQLLSAGANDVSMTLLETRAHLNSLLPVLQHEQTPVAIGSVGKS
jgi:predicted PurR-regulated permease PerM